jgi:hypothetical protein
MLRCKICDEFIDALRSVQVQQSVMANLSADIDQEAASSDEVLPHGLVSVISAQNALSFDRSGGGEPQLVPASMLQVCCTIAQTTTEHPGQSSRLRTGRAIHDSQSPHLTALLQASVDGIALRSLPRI